ncbi:MAG: hypothetical protein AB1714_30300 [Acidobacteriota bacterium]
MTRRSATHFLCAMAFFWSAWGWAEDPPAAPGESDEERKGAFESHDLNADGVLSKEEYAAAQGREFEVADANADGRLSLEEYQAMALAQHARADADRDGVVTMEEHHGHHLGDGDYSDPPQAEGVAAAADGSLSTLDYHVFVDSVIFNTADSDHDFKQTMDEAKWAAEQRFRQMNADRDPYVSRQEYLIYAVDLPFKHRTQK